MRNRVQVFDSCLGTYRDSLSKFHRIRTINPAAPRGARRSCLPGSRDFVADFAIVGREALASRESAGQLFEIFFVRGAGLDRERAIHLLRISGPTFDSLDREVREVVGGAFRRIGLWPRKRYFQIVAENAGGTHEGN